MRGLAFYTSVDICIVSAVRDNLNRIPYIYTVWV
jgi:trehalose 6-phosphate synthase/phosphatase